MSTRMRAGFGAVAAAMAIGGAVAQPAGAQVITDCTVSGGGRLLSAGGDPATFGGTASSERPAPIGNEVYIDHGPATPVQFHSLVITAVVCNFDARRAEILGTGRVETGLGGQLVQFRIGMFAAPPQSALPDLYRITLSNGYDSGERPVEAGNITIQRP